jgi:N-dimethylarginine dimethylaminohydrolase
MSPPDFFEVAHAINPWMKNWPDLVLTADCAVVLDGKAILARYLNEERAGEEEHGRRMFEQLKARGEIDAILRTPDGVYFEGAGDAIFDPGRRLMWMGYGQRSSRCAHHTVEHVFDIRTVSLELVSPHYYHLDTAFCLLSGGDIVYHPAAFSDEGRELIQGLARGQLIEAQAGDAENLGVNSACIGRDVVLCHCSPALRAQLEKRGYRVHVVPLGSGDAAHCLTLRLDNVFKGRQRAGDKLAA